jgi:hypothetical protein
MSDQHFHFDQYIVRPMNEGDREYLGSLISEDAYHRGHMTPDFFLKLVPGEDAWALEDEQGHVELYFKTQVVVRLSIQFAHSKTNEERSRNRTALMKGFAWIESMFRQNKFRQIIFDTQGPELTAFAKRRLGFRESEKELLREIAPASTLPPIGRHTEHWEALPQPTRREG